MEGWGEVNCVGIDPAQSRPDITSVSFDTVLNLLWCGDSLGVSRSFTPSQNIMGMSLAPYTRFKASLAPPVVQLLSHQKGILLVSKKSINFNNRRGLCEWSIDSGNSSFNCAAIHLTLASEFIVGSDTSLIKYNLQKPTPVHQYNYENPVSFISTLAKLLMLGRSDGVVDVFDTTSESVVKTFHGQNGFLSDVDVKGNYMATCGYSRRQKRFHNNDFFVDPLINLYDLRMMRSLPPIPFPAGASFVRFHPKLPNIIIIASSAGNIQFVDMFDPLNMSLYQANLMGPQASLAASTPTYLANLDISENGEYLAFSDGLANVHLWSSLSNTNRNFTNFPTSLDQPDVVVPPASTPIAVDDPVSLASIGLPYYKEFLLSNYPSDLLFEKELLKLPAKIDMSLLESSDFSQVLAYDKLKHGPSFRKYESLKGVKSTGKTSLPKFLSERDKTPVPGSPNSSQVDITLVTAPHTDVFQLKTDSNKIPNCYSRVQIQYSKFGVQDFDFDYYNKSLPSHDKFCGLENHVDNSYVNSLLQLYRLCPIFYNKVVHTLLQEWLPNDPQSLLEMQNPQGSSILNELAYLFDMMYKSDGENVKISNFSQVLNQNQVAQNEQLLNFDELRSVNGVELQALMIKFNKFLIENTSNDQLKQFGDVEDKIGNLFNIVYNLEIRSNGCDFNSTKTANQLTVDLVSPPPSVMNHPGNYGVSKKNHTILTYLDYSLNQVKVMPCNQNQNHTYAYPHSLEIRQTLVHLPPILSINVAFNKHEYQVVRGIKQWLVPEFYSVKTANKISLKPVVTQFNQTATKYELVGYVCEILHDLEATKGKHNLVSYVRHQGQWYLFNDFMVMPILADDVFNINVSWKKPVVVVYADVDSAANRDFEYLTPEFLQNHPVNDSILYRDHFACGVRENYKKEYELLTGEEAPKHGTLVAIDAEFVTLQPEEIEVSWDGTKSLVKPKLLSLARISAIRGDGAGLGTPFVDDYILHTCPIYDYLTSFSGIEPGDLDPHKSTKNLVTLQTAYRRLWLLLNLGVVFVGHGLKNDFRCINLKVPPAQIRDTYDYFYAAEFKRRLSLKFLAYVLLKEHVQTGNHDSIEDAYTALLLYQKYLELRNNGQFESTLMHIYMEGQQLRFKVPE